MPAKRTRKPTTRVSGALKHELARQGHLPPTRLIELFFQARGMNPQFKSEVLVKKKKALMPRSLFMPAKQQLERTNWGRRLTQNEYKTLRLALAEQTTTPLTKKRLLHLLTKTK